MSIKTAEVGCQTDYLKKKGQWYMQIDHDVAQAFGYRKTAKNNMLEPIDTQYDETPCVSRMLLD